MQPVATPTPKPQFGNIIEPPSSFSELCLFFLRTLPWVLRTLPSVLRTLRWVLRTLLCQYSLGNNHFSVIPNFSEVWSRFSEVWSGFSEVWSGFSEVCVLLLRSLPRPSQKFGFCFSELGSGPPCFGKALGAIFITAFFLVSTQSEDILAIVVVSRWFGVSPTMIERQSSIHNDVIFIIYEVETLPRKIS